MAHTTSESHPEQETSAPSSQQEQHQQQDQQQQQQQEQQEQQDGGYTLPTRAQVAMRQQEVWNALTQDFLYVYVFGPENHPAVKLFNALVEGD